MRRVVAAILALSATAFVAPIQPPAAPKPQQLVVLRGGARVRVLSAPHGAVVHALPPAALDLHVEGAVQLQRAVAQARVRAHDGAVARWHQRQQLHALRYRHLFVRRLRFLRLYGVP